jgi:peptidoglycan/LPS O-acetylase OafA/YrhL
MQTAVAVRALEGAAGPVRAVETPSRFVALDALRTFLTLMVVAHHAALAYHPYALPASGSLLTEPRLWLAFPVVDPARLPGLDLFVAFNDIFFMSLMFLLSGLFAWPSLQRKGVRAFLRDRLVRLGVGFLICAALAPLAYFPAHLQRGAHDGFFAQWTALGAWPAGPGWFLWVLFAFDLLAAGLYSLAPSVGGALSSLQPAKIFCALIAFSITTYLPLALAFTPFRWVSFGPFWFQVGRIAHYALYFCAGAALSTRALPALARRWPLWILGALIAFALAVALFLAAMTRESPGWQAIMNLGFPLSCAASSLAFLSLFSRFGDRLRGSRNAYGIYLFHYLFVSWFQYALLTIEAPAAIKFTAVFTGAAALSWLATEALRRLPGAARVI